MKLLLLTLCCVLLLSACSQFSPPDGAADPSAPGTLTPGTPIPSVPNTPIFPTPVPSVPNTPIFPTPVPSVPNTPIFPTPVPSVPGTSTPPMPTPTPVSPHPSPEVSERVDWGFGQAISAEEPLFAPVDSLQQAEELAARYGIRLVQFAQGVATFHTEEDPHRLVELGQERGWPPLSINYMENPYLTP